MKNLHESVERWLVQENYSFNETKTEDNFKIKFNQNLIKFAKSQGYDMFYSVNRGVNIPDNNLDEIKRIAAKGDDRWLKKTLAIFTNNILGSVYGKIKK